MGFVIHPRIGLPENIKFLSDEYLDLMEVAIAEASRQNMMVFLYDEAMYPSARHMEWLWKAIRNMQAGD